MNFGNALFQKFLLTKFKIVKILYLHDLKRIKFTYEIFVS